jgi:hypothetical protein
MSDRSQHRRSRGLLGIGVAIMLLYAASHAYHVWHLRVRCPTGTFLRSVMEFVQAPMILSRMFAPLIGVIVAIRFLARDSRKALGVVFLAVMVVGCFISFPYIRNFFAFFMR